MPATPKQQGNSPSRPNMYRPKLIQLIHVAKKQLALSDENYRSMIAAVKKGAGSCADLNILQLGELYKSLKTVGFRPTKKIPSHAPRNRSSDFASDRQLNYIRGLWELASSTKSESSLNKMCFRVTGVAMIQWLTKDKASKLILALRDIAAKQGYSPDSAPQS